MRAQAGGHFGVALAGDDAMTAADLIHRLPRHLKMSELRVFAAVLEHRSFRKAAAELHLTQPAVTKSIAGLEGTLGVKLFDRVAIGVEPTVHGRSFAPRAQAVFDELRRAARELTLLSSGAVGTLRVGVMPMPGMAFLPAAVNRMLQEQPDIVVSLVEQRETALLNSLRKGDIDLAILHLALAEPQDDLRVQRLFDERLCVLAAPSHPLAARSQLQWSDLLAQRWVMPPADCSFCDYVRRSLGRPCLPMPKPAVEAMSIQLQSALMLHAGMLGFGMRSEAVFAPGMEVLVRLPFDLPVTTTSVAALSLRSHEPSPLARQFIGHLQALLQATAAVRVAPARHRTVASDIEHECFSPVDAV